MTLQLYQIDNRNYRKLKKETPIFLDFLIFFWNLQFFVYLLDFANKIPSNKPRSLSESLSSLDLQEDIGRYSEQGKVITKDGERKMPEQHIIMEFFEMCSLLIKALAGGG